MREDEQEFWQRVEEYRRRFEHEDFRGRVVAAGLQLRRESEDTFADFADCAVFAGDTEDEQDYIRWLQKAEEDVGNRIALAISTARNEEDAEAHLSFAYAILREVSTDALSRRPMP